MDSHTDSRLPFNAVPHDSMRLGLPSLKDDAAMLHPVQAIQQGAGQQSEATKMQMLKNLYGVALPARMQIEAQILGRFTRMPGLPSSKLGLESLTGTLDDFSYESYLGLPEDSTDVPVDLHSQMERKLGMGTKPIARGIV